MTAAGSNAHRELVGIKHKITEKEINSDRHIEAVRQMRARKGPIYKKWKTRWEAVTGLKVGRRRKKNVDKSGG